MQTRFHGVLSLILIAGAFLFGFYLIWESNPLAALIYGALLFFGSLTIIYAFCSKCPIRNSGCRHVFPGLLTRWLPTRPETAYALHDYLTVLLVLLMLIAYPHPWLFLGKSTLVVFWALLLAGLTEIVLCVCKGCGNVRCLVCQIRNRSVSDR